MTGEPFGVAAPILATEGLAVHFGGLRALNNVNLSDYVWIVWLKKGLPEVKNVIPQLLPPDMAVASTILSSARTQRVLVPPPSIPR